MNTIVTYKPSRALNLWNDFDHLFGRFFEDNPVWNARRPVVDVREEEGRYVLEAELPGLTEKDIDIKVEGNLLTLSSTKAAEGEKKESGWLIRERSSAFFQRSFVLPKDVQADKVEAVFKNGLLELSLIKSPESKPRSIKIRAS